MLLLLGCGGNKFNSPFSYKVLLVQFIKLNYI
jgi:hypothetical protein